MLTRPPYVTIVVWSATLLLIGIKERRGLLALLTGRWRWPMSRRNVFNTISSEIVKRGYAIRHGGWDARSLGSHAIFANGERTLRLVWDTRDASVTLQEGPAWNENLPRRFGPIWRDLIAIPIHASQPLESVIEPIVDVVDRNVSFGPIIDPGVDPLDLLTLPRNAVRGPSAILLVASTVGGAATVALSAGWATYRSARWVSPEAVGAAAALAWMHQLVRPNKPNRTLLVRCARGLMYAGLTAAILVAALYLPWLLQVG